MSRSGEWNLRPSAYRPKKLALPPGQAAGQVAAAPPADVGLQIKGPPTPREAAMQVKNNTVEGKQACVTTSLAGNKKSEQKAVLVKHGVTGLGLRVDRSVGPLVTDRAKQSSSPPAGWQLAFGPSCSSGRFKTGGKTLGPNGSCSYGQIPADTA